jgi:uncharacterized protein YndB with AHSA1/START domain
MAESRSPTRSIEKTVTIRASREAVWKALTEAEGIMRWFAPEARVEPGLGGKIFLSWGPGMEGESTITAWEPQSHVQTGFGSQNGLQLYVDYFVAGAGGETTVRLVHSGFSADAQWDGEYESHDRGWSVFMRNLRHALERHPNASCIQSTFAEKTALSKRQAWDVLLGPRGLDQAGAFADSAPHEGDPFRLTMADGNVLEGKVEIFAPGRDLALTLANFDDALLRLSFEGSADTFVFVVVLSYGLPTEVGEKLRHSFAGLLKILEAPQPA